MLLFLALGACSGGDDKALVTSKVGDISVADFNEKAKSLTGSYVVQQMLTEKVLADKYEVTDKEVQEAYDMTAANWRQFRTSTCGEWLNRRRL